MTTGGGLFVVEPKKGGIQMGGLVQVLPRDWVRSDLVTMLAVRGKKVLVAYNDTVGDISVCDHEFADVEEARAWAERVGKEVGGDR